MWLKTQRFLAAAVTLGRNAATAVLGSWSWKPPTWLATVLARALLLAQKASERPTQSLVILACVAGLGVGGAFSWRWYQHRPQPQYALFQVTSPGRTRIEVEGAKPDPLLIVFDRSVAKLSLIGRDIPKGIRTNPSLQGAWRWQNDRTLEFRVQEDWPVGRAIKVTLDNSVFGPAVVLKENSFKFDTAAFSAKLVDTQLYQDPVNPGVKNAVFDLEFSHPVEASSLEKRIELHLASGESASFTLVYDKLKLHASIHSGTLPIPHDESRVFLSLRAGTNAARGGNDADKLTASVAVPGLYSLRALSIEPQVVNNERDEPQQLMQVGLSAATGEAELKQAISAWVLPKIRPAEGRFPQQGSDESPYHWYSPGDVTPSVLARAELLSLAPVPTEREFVEDRAFSFHADVGRFVLVKIAKNLRSFGGYLSAEDRYEIVRVPDFPPRLSIMSRGSLLALAGDKKVVVMVRDIPGMRARIGRLLPDQLQHLVTQTYGEYGRPNFFGSMSEDNLVERFQLSVPLAGLSHGQTQYEPIDLDRYMHHGAEQRRGIFLLTVESYDPKAEAREKRLREENARRTQEPKVASHTPIESGEGDEYSAEEETDWREGEQAAALKDQRLIVVTDLGLIVKQVADGSQDVFVQSIASGQPSSNVTVEVIAKNGTALASQPTDELGHVHLPALSRLAAERSPILIQARKGDDVSFLPLNRADRNLDLTRFDIGGIRSPRVGNEISAYLFSDRGLYRPGDPMHIGVIIKGADWSSAITGIPLETELVDARGLIIRHQKLRLPAGGFAEIEHTTTLTAPTGVYSANVYLDSTSNGKQLLGSTSLRVQEFEPDRMKLSVHLSHEHPDGWTSPTDLKASLHLQNLFGTPAQQRRIESTLTLTPAFPAFRAYPDYRFYDSNRVKDGYSDVLKATLTDSNGDANIDLDLAKYANATYRIHLLARAFEAQSGRSVSSEISGLVSPQPFLVGFKTDGKIDYLTRDSKHFVSLLAIDPSEKPMGANGLSLTRVEVKYVSVLARQPNGTFKYESRKKEIERDHSALDLPAEGAQLALDASEPGNFAYLIKNSAGQDLNRIDYTVAGNANLTRSLDRDAELDVRLNKTEYAPGDEIELSIKAPYVGAGLITIERDRVYAVQWFKSSTTASVQHIKLPTTFEGNGYVSVQFTRDFSSDEIYASPLSYGVIPFTTNLHARTNTLSLNSPALIKSGSVLPIQLKSAHPTRAVVFAVDTGILEVARYQKPDPLALFFKKRALEVRTSQILDLILPEFKRVMAAAAPGGDGEAAIKSNLNPFKRKRAPPAVYWSGIVDVQGERQFDWTVPDSFNGQVRIFAVSVDGGSIGIAQAESTVRADFVLSPTLPAAVTPGDEFEVALGVANVLPDSDGAQIQVRADLPENLEPVGELSRTLQLDSMREGVAVFRLKARAELGSAAIRFSARWQNHDAQLVDSVSVRPSSPHTTEITAGHFSESVRVKYPRDLYPNFRKLKLGISALPLVLSNGIADYLDDYPHLCTEQLVSRGFPALLLASHPELASTEGPRHSSAQSTAALVEVLRARQNEEGGFSLWSASIVTDEFASVYAIHWMLEARDQGESIPDDLLQRSMAWLQAYAASSTPDTHADSDIWMLRNRAYAAYLLTRQGSVTTPIVGSLRQTLDARFRSSWKKDLAGAYLAAVYRLQKQDREAERLMDPLQEQLGKRSSRPFFAYDDDAIRDATVFYLIAKHFPERSRALPAQTLEAILEPLTAGQYNTLYVARLLIAMQAYTTTVPTGASANYSASGLINGTPTPIELKGSLVMLGDFDNQMKTLELQSGPGVKGFYSLTTSGFDRSPPATAVQQGLEIEREYLDEMGKPLTSVPVGGEVLVRLRMRSIDSPYSGNIAIIDLLPGGFEPILQSPQSQDDSTQPAAHTRRWFNRLGSLGNWSPEFADIRDDRVVLYGSLTRDVAEYTYRIRATNVGTFKTPPAIAQSMYDRRLVSRTTSGSLVVMAPGGPK